MATCFVHMQDTAQKFCNLTNPGQLTGWSCIGVSTEAKVFQFSLILLHSLVWGHFDVELIFRGHYCTSECVFSFTVFSVFAHGPMMYNAHDPRYYWEQLFVLAMPKTQSTFLNSASWANLQSR